MIVVTGATGFVGSHVVERFRADTDLLLVSRDPAGAERRFPGVRACRYDELRGRDLAGATVIHLAARNNDHPGTAEEFRATNVDLLLEVAAVARTAGARRFINLCSTHALQPRPGDHYGLSKQEGARRLAAFWPQGAVNLYVPALYAREFRGRLAMLDRLPAALRPLALRALRQVAPVLSVDTLTATLRVLVAEPPRDAGDSWAQERYIADPVPANGLFAAVKRAIDLAAALAVAVLAGWAMLLIAAYIRLDSRGPAVFAQRRVGQGGRIFTCYKFRTMAVGTAHVATHQATAASVTRAGRFLRRTKLDELPQIVNVFLNQMSLVGPRPCLPVQEELVARREARGVLRLKPGITGLAQINDIDMSDPARLAAWDDRYRAFRTLRTDILILLRTVVGGGSGDRTAPATPATR
jgi:lipopolysaccharide/colanic/teichoic acid biosynthesis glycosyltransferase